MLAHQRIFFPQRYDGAPKPADSEALDLLQSECPHLYDELSANGQGEVLIDPKKNFDQIGHYCNLS